MNSEPTHNEIRDDDLDFVTKSDVRKSQEDLAGMMANSFKNVASKDDLAAMESRLDQKFATKNDLKTFKDDIVREFKVVAENIHQDVAGANADEISLIKDQKLPDHEDRITALEEHTGLPIGPRHAT